MWKPLIAVASIASSAAGSATAQVYPARPVTMVVPFTAGGPPTRSARIMAEGMRGSLGQPVIIENVGGASGSIGVGRVARAAPDGYTLMLGSLAHACRERRHLCIAVRPAERFRAGPLIATHRCSSSEEGRCPRKT